jgi:hypothetical protein
VRYETHSDWLIQQWYDMIGWKECGYVGLDRNACSQPLPLGPDQGNVRHFALPARLITYVFVE